MVPFLTAGSVFASRFEIERLAGTGGMGSVYRAVDQLTLRWVALKIIHAHSSNPGDATRFIREAELLSELRHPGIVSYVAHGVTPQGQRFLAMEWLEGEDLAQRLLRGPLGLTDTRTLLYRVAESLAFAHQRGILHRDLKPTNLFLPGKDLEQVKILDFGIARRIEAARAITRTGMVIGTPEYMAPEQARGSRELTAAADLFSLGCVFYECLAGQPPFVGEHVAAVLVRILFEEPVPLRQRLPGIPASISQLVQRLLIKDPTQRLGVAAELVAALAALGEDFAAAQLPTLALQPRSQTVQSAGGEQALVSLVMAQEHESGLDAEPKDLSEETPAGVAELLRHQTLLEELRPVGVETTTLIGGALVVRVPPMENAQDQAALAARVALLVAERWPGARIAVVTGRGRLSEGNVTGEAIDRAWRLLIQSQTSPSADTLLARIIVDEVSAGLLDGRFDLRKNSSEGYVLAGELWEADAERRLLGKPTPCVGRDRELAMLEGVLTECKEESVARAILVLAPPGLGKSRLRHEFLRRIETRREPVCKLLGRGDPMKVKASYGLLGEALRGLWGLSPRDTRSEQQHVLVRAVQQSFPNHPEQSQQIAGFLGELCGVPFADAENPRLRAARQEPAVMRDQVEQAWLSWLRVASTEQPVLLILEDLHWADALTVKLVHAALHELKEQPLMVLALGRPEVKDLFPNLWGGLVQPVMLHVLPKRAGERLVRQILGTSEDPATVARIVEQAAGNPLLLEELIRESAEHGGAAVPGTVLAILQARMARLSAGARRVLRAASVFGQTFSESGVRSLLRLSPTQDTSRTEFDELIHEEFVEMQRDWHSRPGHEYVFHHALMRDAAYGLLTEEELVTWHCAAGQLLESEGIERPGQLAEHFRLGRQKEKAVTYFLRAAEQAHEAADLELTLTCVEQGLGCGAQGTMRGELLSLRIAAGLYRERFHDVLLESPEALSLLRPGSLAWCRIFVAYFPAAAFLEGKLLPVLMQTFLQTTPSPDARATYVYGASLLSVMSGIVGQKESCKIVLARAIEVGAALHQSEHNALAVLHGAQANWHEQIVKLPYTNWINNQNATLGLEAAGNRPTLASFGVYLGKSLLDLGQREAALVALRHNLALAEQLRDETPLTYSRTYLGRALALSHDPQDWHTAEQLAQPVTTCKNASMLGLAHGVLAQVALQRGDLVQAESAAQTACGILRAFPPYKPDIVALHAQILHQMGKSEAAVTTCEEMLRELTALDIEPYGVLALYAELAISRQAIGDAVGTQAAVVQALPILQRRVKDIPDAAGRAVYLSQVAENARLLRLAAAHSIELPDELRTP